jgi:hypothetical protein
MVVRKVDTASSDALVTAVRDRRDMALRSRLLASALSLNRDRETAVSYAEELEREAETLERQVTGRLDYEAE